MSIHGTVPSGLAPPHSHLTDAGVSPRRPLIELRQVLKVYDTPAGGFTALKNIDLTVYTGEFVAIIGKSGSGKSTLINMITGIDRPTLGEVVVSGIPIHALSEDEMAIRRGQNLGVIFQFFQLLPTLTVLENIMLPMELRQTCPSNQRKERAMELLEMVDLGEQAHKFPAAISGGQQQRVAIARALANDPDVLVGDEPTGSLDSKTADSIFQLFESLVAQGKTILLVTHDRELASRIPRVVFIEDGEITDQYVAQALPAMTQRELASVSSKLEPVRYEAGQTIVQQGDPANSFYIIVRGHVDVLIQHPSGTEVTAGRLGPGQYFGEIGLLEGGKRTATVRADLDEEVLLMQLARDDFASLVSGSELTNKELIHLMRQRVMEKQLLTAMPGLDAQQLDSVMSNAERMEYQPGEIIYRQDDPADSFYIMVEGQADMLRRQLGGDEVLTGQLGPGEYFGEIGLLEGGKRQMTVQASQDSPVVALQLEKYKLEAVLAASDMTRDALFHLMRQRVIELYLHEAVPELSPEEIDELMERIESTEYMPGDIIVKRGDPASKFFVIASGQVDLLDDQSEAVKKFFAGESFGEEDMLGSIVYSQTARATKRSRVLAINKETITELTDTYQLKLEEIVSRLTQRFSATTMHFRLSDIRSAADKKDKDNE